MNKVAFLIVGFALGIACGLFLAHRGALPPSSPGGAPAAPASQQAAQSRQPSRADESALKTAVEALEAVVSAVRSGLTYQQYLERKVNAHVAVDHYFNTRGQDAPLGITLKEAIAAFDAAGTLWSACITEDACPGGLINSSTPPASIEPVFLHYPGLAALGNPIQKDIALSYLWQEGATQTAAARAAL